MKIESDLKSIFTNIYIMIESKIKSNMIFVRSSIFKKLVLINFIVPLIK